MKRFFQFLLIFLLVLVAAYIYPVIFSSGQTEKTKSDSLNTVVSNHRALAYKELETTGYAAYIGTSEADWVATFGEPQEKFTSPLGYSWWVYPLNKSSYLQVSVKEGRITSIFTLGENSGTSPFSVNMSIREVTKVTSLYSNFSFQYNEQDYQFELSEEDMNDFPLVAFKNGTFAILHFCQKDKHLLGIRYLDKATLLQIMPYSLQKGEAIPMTITEDINWEQVKEESKFQLISILNSIRTEEKLSNYEVSLDLEKQAQSALLMFQTDPNKVITKNQRQQAFQIHQEMMSLSDPFTMNSSEFERLIKLQKSSEDFRGFFYSPAYDIPWMIMDWYREDEKLNQLFYQEDQQLGVAFSKEDLLVYFFDKHQSDETETKESDEK